MPRRFAAGTEVKGEITLVIDLGAPVPTGVGGAEGESGGGGLLAKGLSKRDAAAALAVCLGVAHRRPSS